MSGWAIVAVIAIIVWGIVRTAQLRSTGRDEQGPAASAAQAEARAEIARLQERIKVLERIVTDSHSSEGIERDRLEREIAALREGQPSDGGERPLDSGDAPATSERG